MTDKELLELAAKAYWGDEIDDVCWIEWSEADQCISYMHGENQDHNGIDQTYLWNPLTDDGNALRLAVKLGIDIGLDPATNITSAYCNSMNERLFERHGNDPYAATRRAIVRAAAEIGKGTESQS